MKNLLLLLSICCLSVVSCKNRDVNPINNDTLPMHERKPIKATDFDSVMINGEVYYIMERDRNNPHEGFGFMALKGKKIHEKQDSIMAYQQVILRNQIRILERLENRPADEIEYEVQQELDLLLGQ